MKLVFLSYLLYQIFLSIVRLYAFLVSLILDGILKGVFFFCLNDVFPADVQIELCHMLSFGRFNRQ